MGFPWMLAQVVEARNREEGSNHFGKLFFAWPEELLDFDLRNCVA